MYKLGMSIGALTMCAALVMLIKSKRKSKTEIIAAVGMAAIIGIALSEIL